MATVSIVTSLHRPSDQDHANAARTIALARETVDVSESIVVDTSPIASAVAHYADRYLWTDGRNIGYGGALNLAAATATGDAIIYFSAKRATTLDSKWFARVLEPLRDPNCGMAGSVKRCQFDRIARRPCDIWEPQIHVQGGVFAIRTQVLRDNPYSDYFPQVFSDVFQGWNLIKSGYYLADVPEVCAVEAGVGSSHAMVRCDYRNDHLLDERFDFVCRNVSDINEHCATLRDLAARANHVTEFGVRSGKSTISFLAGRPRVMRSYDIDPQTDVDHVLRLVPAGTDFRFQIGDSRVVEIEPTDLLFIDTDHNFDTLITELRHNAVKVSRRIVCHDTAAFPPCMEAVKAFVAEDARWRILQHYENNNGLTILERQSGWPDWRRGL